MNRFFLVALAVMSVFALSASGQADLRVGIDRDMADQWEALVYRTTNSMF